jgi:flavin reductase (DIM6/NTAB) family NADH-FMN oxidoreductase RutF
MIIGTVVAIHINPNILDEEGKIDYDKANIIARMGYSDYLVVDKSQVFSGTRPDKLIKEVIDKK